uniref:Hexosyltransferase n=1 Tax=Plectus sambesii TaxID=2011161 RepID=A0A914X256_9BILA
MNYPAKYYIRYIPFSYGLLLLLVANSSRVILEEREMWMDIDKKLTAKLAIESANSDPKDLKPFSIDLVNSILRITELEAHCSEDRPPWLLVLVFSRAESRRQRDEARRTWITQLFLAERPGTVKVVFVVGVKRGVDLVVRVRDEYRARRDMLVLFTDESPEDSIIKTLAAFQWVNEVCASSTHILKVNDDTFIDVGRFGVFVRTVVESNRYRNLPVIFGQCLTNVKVNRNPELMR